MHMHYGGEEMFFVLGGRPVFRNQHSTETLAPGDFVFCPEGRAGLHTFSNPTDEPVGCWRSVPGASPTSSPIRKTDTRGWPPAIRSELLARGGDPGIVTRFEIPIE